MKWTTRWGYLTTPTKDRGVYRIKTGGYFVRARVTDAQGNRKPLTAVVHGTQEQAVAERRRLVDDARAELRGVIRLRQSLADFAVSRLEQRVERGHVESEATIELWKGVIPIFVAEWGHLNAPDLSKHHINRWLDTKVREWMTKGRPQVVMRRPPGVHWRKKVEKTPVTIYRKWSASRVNGVLRVLRALCHAIKVKWSLPVSAFEGIEFFNEGRKYTVEQPNALPPNELLARFMSIAKKYWPQHYAMIVLGIVTGLRPSQMRPLRRKGPHADINWETGVLLTRRSHSRGQVVMDKTKTKTDGIIALPADVLAILADHAASIDAHGGAMAESELLFPSLWGTVLNRGVLARPFADIAARMELPFKLTPRGMRRTFNDVTRAAGVDKLVTRSISGHQTEEMQMHYSTAQLSEQREAIARAHALTRDENGETKGQKKGQSE